MNISSKISLPSISQVGKSTLARLLASENITIIHDAVLTASFDLKNRLLRLPNWASASRELNDMLVGHEVSHALHTPMQEWADGMERIHIATGKDLLFCKAYMNIVEDARIERLIKIKFPGLRRDFFIAYEALTEMKIFGDISKPETMNLGDRLNLHFKLGLHRGVVIPFANDEKKWIVEMNNTTTFDSVIVLTIAIINSLKEASQPQSNQDQEVKIEMKMGKGDGDGEGEELQSVTSKDENDEVEDNEDDVTCLNTTYNCVQDNTPQSMPQTNEEMEKNIVEKLSEPQSTSGKIPTILRCKVPDSHHVVVPYSTILRDVRADVAAASSAAQTQFDAMLKPIMVEEIKIAARSMASAFNRRKAADVFKRSSIARTGNLDPLRMNQYRWCDDVFRKTVKVAEGKNHGICILVDWSGSMSWMLQSTVRQMIILTDFCRMSNIPFEVYAFTDHLYIAPTTESYGSSADQANARAMIAQEKYKTDTTLIRPISLLNFLSSSMNKTDYEYAKSFLFNIRTLASSLNHGNNFSLSGTPTCAALYEMSHVVREFRVKSNVQVCHTVVLSDGDACDSAQPNDDLFAKIQTTIPNDNPGRPGLWHTQGVMDDPMTGESYDIRQVNRKWTKENPFGNRWSFGSIKVPTDAHDHGVWIACDILRRRTGSKIHWIGLRDSGRSTHHGVRESRNSNWKRDGFVRGSASGFDSVVILNANRFAGKQPSRTPSSFGYGSPPNAPLTKAQLQKEFIGSQCENNCSKMIASIVGAEIGTS